MRSAWTFLSHKQAVRCSSYNKISATSARSPTRLLLRAGAPPPHLQNMLLTPAATVLSFKQHLGRSLYHTTSLRTLNLSLSASKKEQALVTRPHGYGFICAYLHTWQPLRSKAKPAKSKKSGGEYGSVLTQFVGKKEEPKQITVSTKGLSCARVFHTPS